MLHSSYLFNQAVTLIMSYSFFKYLHILTINLTFGFFIVRGYWMIINSPLLSRWWVLIVPHVNDTLLLTTALIMTYLQGWHLFTQGWLIVKLMAVCVYIILASIALRPGRAKLIRMIAWLLALIVFGYIIVIAVSKDPWPF